jgi:multidrug efflux pump subunit AcrA (membrane-fusion protein)
VQPEKVPLIVEAPGSIVPRDRIQISSQINGFVREVRVREGDRVDAGQLLLTLDSRDAAAQREAAEAGMAQAQAAIEEAKKSAVAAARAKAGAEAGARLAAETHERYQKLSESRSVSAHEMSEVRTRLESAKEELAAREALASAAQDRVRQAEQRIRQARSDIERADVLLGWTVVRAPSASVVSSRLVDRGSAVFAGTPLIRLDSVARARVLADLPSKDAALLKPGLEVNVSTENASVVQGRVVEISPITTPGMHTVQFKVDLAEQASVRVGGFARVRIPSGERIAFLIPRSAILESGQLMGVYIADSNQIARFRLLRTFPHDGDTFEVAAGLEAGDRLVLDPPSALVDGAPLEIRR